MNIRTNRKHIMLKKNYQLILYDNDTSTFDDVIDSLMSVCAHNIYQAEQCATLIHHKGEISVLTGRKKELEQKSTQLGMMGLTSKVKKTKL